MIDDDIKKLHELLDKTPLGLGGEEGSYAEYIDEARPEGGVQICRKDGTVVLRMPTSLWDQLRKKPDAQSTT